MATATSINDLIDATRAHLVAALAAAKKFRSSPDEETRKELIKEINFALAAAAQIE